MTTIPEGVRVRRLWSWMPMGGLTLGDTIWLAKGQEGLLPHELVHIRQQRELGFLGHALRYAFWPHYRVRAEAEAYAVSVRGGESLEWAARCLSGALYLWPCSRDEARDAIRRALVAAGDP
jgi:hypothetical protein